MPELPEVETVRRGLVPYLEGRVLERVEVLDPRLVLPLDPAVVEQRLAGATVERVDRRGKYLLLVLDTGDVAVHHLRMTGSFATAPAGAPDPVTHVRARYAVGDASVVYRDPRRFGTLLVDHADTVHAYLEARLGPEPLDDGFDARVLRAGLQRRRAPIKAVLLDQKVVAGLGNIYVDEALHLARIAPHQAADAVSAPASARLRDAIVARLEEAIAVGGSTLRDYRGVEGSEGGMQERFLVYGKAGLPCPTCGRTLRGARIAGRSTTWCAHCQPLRRSRRG